MQNRSNNKAEVNEFLRSFQEKRRTFEIIFMDRPKNKQTMLDLEIRPIEREKFIDQLSIEDFSEGPLPEEWHGSKEMWVFGRGIKGEEVYIKICLGAPNSNVICISFYMFIIDFLWSYGNSQNWLPILFRLFSTCSFSYSRTPDEVPVQTLAK